MEEEEVTIGLWTENYGLWTGLKSRLEMYPRILENVNGIPQRSAIVPLLLNRGINNLFENVDGRIKTNIIWRQRQHLDEGKETNNKGDSNHYSANKKS